MGGWDGLFTTGASDADMRAGWSNNYHWKPTNTLSELDTYKSPSIYGAKGSKYSSFTYAMCGTGPYKFTSWDIVNKIWRIDYFSDYWRGFGQAGNGAGNFIDCCMERG
jgi:ABC-type transport system substrate-binding protein